MVAAGVSCFIGFSTLQSPKSVALHQGSLGSKKSGDGNRRNCWPLGSWSGDPPNLKSGASATCNIQIHSYSQIRLWGTGFGRFALVSAAAAEQTVLSRKFDLLAKRPTGYFRRRRNGLLNGDVACSAAAAPPMASLSAVTLSGTYDAIARSVATLDVAVLQTSFRSAFNLISLCTFVVWMQMSGKLPADTPVTLSQVSFTVFIPCFLASKVAMTLKQSASLSLLVLPLLAVVHVTIGATAGKLACHLFIKAPSLDPGVNSSAEVEEDHRRRTRALSKKRALITTCCAFGNSLTLPLVFLTGALTKGDDMNRAVGYLALYMVGWSPAMWSGGYKILTGGNVQESVSNERQPIWRSVAKGIKDVLNPPIYGVLLGILIGGTPLSHFFLGHSGGAALASTLATSGTLFQQIRGATAGLLSPLFEAASLLGSASLAVQTVVLATSLGATMLKARDKPKTGPAHETDSKRSGGSGQIETSEATLDSTAFWVISLIRLVFLPTTGLVLTSVLKRYHLLPVDPIFTLVLLVEYAMPTAQNLVLLVQLYPGTRFMAGMLANLLLRQYALSIVSLTIWMSIFLKLTPII